MRRKEKSKKSGVAMRTFKKKTEETKGKKKNEMFSESCHGSRACNTGLLQ